MRYLCTVLASATTPASLKTFTPDDTPATSILVKGTSLRDAAARAYVRLVGRDRAKGLRERGTVRPEVIAQETNPRAIAASLRKVSGRQGLHYEMDNYSDAWSIRVQPALSSRTSSRSRSRTRLLLHFSRFPSPN